MAQWDALQQRIQELEASNANQTAAATILQEMINSGELTQQDNGSIAVSSSLQPQTQIVD